MTTLVEIEAALDRGEFFLEYLPIISLADGHCLGAEALTRWRRGDSVVRPDQFIPFAENTPLSGLITYWVLETVAAELGEWLDANPRAQIGINAPPEILGRGGMAYVARKSGLLKNASQLVLEITERGLPDLVGVDAINARARMGVRLALDDVTLVGGANLAILARANFDAIKLDKSLIDQLAPGASPEWLHTITAVLAASQMMVTAEGVENEYQVAMLRSARIQAAQGFYFSPSLPAGGLMAFYQDHRERAGA